MKKTQIDFVRSRLQRYGSITRNQALRNYISRLSAIIHTLRHEEGMEIEGTYIKTKTPFGEGRDYKYFLKK